MKRIDCLQTVTSSVTDELVVTGIAGTFWEYNSLTDYEGSLTIGAMGGAAATALGLALALPHRRVISLDGDGSTMLDLAVVTTIGLYQPQNLRVVVFDNEVYSGSTISNPTATATSTDLAAIARGAGIASAQQVTDQASFDAVARCLTDPNAGLQYIVAKVEEDRSARKLPKPTRDYLENKYRFVRYLERTEGRTILPTLR